MTHIKVVIHLSCAFWYVYDVGKTSRIHHNGIFHSGSVIGCMASWASRASTLAPLPAELPPPSGGGSCPMLLGIFHRANASKSNRIWVFDCTICSIIQRSGTLARACRAVFSALPPPTSAHHQPTTPRKIKRSKTYQSDTQRTTPLTHRSGISRLPLVQPVFRLWALVSSMIYQEPRGDTSSGGTSRGAI
jgi:hypothetical protein